MFRHLWPSDRCLFQLQQPRRGRGHGMAGLGFMLLRAWPRTVKLQDPKLQEGHLRHWARDRALPALDTFWLGSMLIIYFRHGHEVLSSLWYVPIWCHEQMNDPVIRRSSLLMKGCLQLVISDKEVDKTQAVLNLRDSSTSAVMTFIHSMFLLITARPSVFRCYMPFNVRSHLCLGIWSLTHLSNSTDHEEHSYSASVRETDIVLSDEMLCSFVYTCIHSYLRLSVHFFCIPIKQWLTAPSYFYAYWHLITSSFRPWITGHHQQIFICWQHFSMISLVGPFRSCIASQVFSMTGVRSDCFMVVGPAHEAER